MISLVHVLLFMLVSCFIPTYFTGSYFPTKERKVNRQFQNHQLLNTRRHTTLPLIWCGTKQKAACEEGQDTIKKAIYCF